MQTIYGNNDNRVLPPKPVAGPIKRPSFEKYVDPTGEFTSSELKYSFWYVKHRLLLYRLAFFGLILFSVITWVYSLYGWGNYLIFGYTADQKLTQQLASSVNYVGIHAHFAPQPLAVLKTYILPGGVEKYDALADVANLNQRWRLSFDYSFVLDGKETPPQHTSLLPGEKRPIAYFGIDGAGGPPLSSNLHIQNVAWQRVSNKTVPDVKSWQAERINFQTDKFVFTPMGSATGINANDIQFTLTNASAYGYVAPQFYVALLSGGDTVAVMPLAFDQFASLETKQVDIRNFVANLNATDVQIFPLIDIYSPDVYLPPPH